MDNSYPIWASSNLIAYEYGVATSGLAVHALVTRVLPAAIRNEVPIHYLK